MARAAVKAKQQARAKTQTAAKPARRTRGRRRHAAGGNPNQQLFFNRLRRQAKWMYVILAVLFAITFAALGVGSGTNSGLDQLFSGLNPFGSGGNSVGKAEKLVQEHPAKGYRALATAYEQKGDNGNAISALQQYTTLRPKDASAFSELGGLQLTQAQQYVQQYQEAIAAQQLAAPGQPFRPGGTLGKALGTDPIEQAAAQQANGTTTDLYQKASLAFQGAIRSYRSVTKLQPKAPNAWFQLANAAQNGADYATARTAYEKYLKLNPSSPQRQQIESLIQQLKKAGG